MPKQYLEAILKLIKLTYDNKIKWFKVREGSLQTIPPTTFTTKYNDKYFVIYKNTSVLSSKIGLYISNDKEGKNVFWEFPHSERINDLYSLIVKKEKEENLPDIVTGFLKDDI